MGLSIEVASRCNLSYYLDKRQNVCIEKTTKINGMPGNAHCYVRLSANVITLNQNKLRFFTFFPRIAAGLRSGNDRHVKSGLFPTASHGLYE